MKSLAEWIFTDEADMNKMVLSTFSGDYSLADIKMGMDHYIQLLEKEGDLKGKRIALMVPDIPPYLELVLAINQLDGVVIPLGAQLRENDLTKLLDFIKPHMVFTIKEFKDFPFYDVVRKWAEGHSNKTILFSSNDGVEWTERKEMSGVELPVEEGPVRIIAYSSGSTGEPKGIMFDNDYFEFQKLTEIFQLTIDDRVFQNTNTSLTLGIMWLIVALKVKCHLISPETFDVPRIVQMFKTYQPTKVSTTPTLLRAIYSFAKNMKAMDGFNSLQLCCLSGEMIPKDLMDSISEIQHSRFESAFGISEAGQLMFTPKDIRESIEWEVFDDVGYKIVDGELLFKIPHPFIGYYRRPDLTQEVFTEDGWFKSGDLALMNSNHKIELMGRKKYLIKKGGQGIIPGEVEQTLSTHPLVKQVVVIGVPDRALGEKVVAFVVKKTEVPVQELKLFCANQIATYKVPDEIHFINEIPSINGKADRISLRRSIAPPV